MRSTASLALFALIALALLPRPGEAQIRFDGIEASAGFFGWEGDDFRSVQPGPRFSGAPLFRVGELWNVGIEGSWADSEVQLVRIPIAIEETNISALLRRSFADPTGVHVFAQVRGGWSKLDSEIAEGEDGALVGYSQSGYALGAEIGVGFEAGRYVDVMWAGGFGWNSYSQCEIFGPSGDYPYVDFGDSCSAIRWGIRAGVVLGRSDG